MDEKILIQSKKRNFKLFILIMLVFSFVITPLLCGYIGALITWDGMFFDWMVWAGFAVLTPFFLIVTFVIYLWLSKISLTITDKRIYGKAAFGKRIDFPLDKVSAFGTSWLKGIYIGTSAGKIKFKLIKNRNEIFDTLSNLFIEREKNAANSIAASASAAPAADNADQILKYKSLLDSGVITKEEFDAKKKELLGL